MTKSDAFLRSILQRSRILVQLCDKDRSDRFGTRLSCYISRKHEEKRINADKTSGKILHQCPLRDGMYYIHDLAWLGINLLSTAPEMTESREHSEQIQAYIAGITITLP